MSAVLNAENRGQSRDTTPTPTALGAETILFGVGNCGRSDDGLGWAFLDRIQREPGFVSPIEYRYQLQVEDAALIANMQRVVFIDSYQGELPGGYRWTDCEPSENFEFTTHVLPPRGVMHYCKDLYGRTPQAHILMIQGCDWGLRNGMSSTARRHLDTALAFFRDQILWPH